MDDFVQPNGTGKSSRRAASRDRRARRGVEIAPTLERTLAAAYRLLSAQARTDAELRAALVRRGYCEDHINAVMDEMRRAGYIDDEAAAQRWACRAAQDRAYGMNGIASRLARRGIEPELARSAADEAYEAEGVDEYVVALELARKRIRPGERDDDERRERARRRVAWFLERRGFRIDTIARVTRELFE